MMELQYSVRSSKRENIVLHIDPRTKLLILILGNLTLICSGNLKEEFVLEVAILVFGLIQKKYKFITKMFVSYLVLLTLQFLGSKYLSGMINVMIVTFAVFIRKLMPCCMLGGIIVSTTRVNEFMAAMNKIHMPKTVVIPLTVMLRYFPMIKEDWHSIKDAMKMRGISPNLIRLIKKPAMTMECIYVPMMMSASKIADELSAAAVTRGIENPKPRTCMQTIRFTIWDYVCTAYFLILFTVFVIY